MITRIRNMHPHSFRSGEWAIVVGVETKRITNFGNTIIRPCFLVVFPDGATDSWVIFDINAKYEFEGVEAGS